MTLRSGVILRRGLGTPGGTETDLPSYLPGPPSRPVGTRCRGGISTELGRTEQSLGSWCGDLALDPARQDLGSPDLPVHGERGQSGAPTFSPSPRDPETRGSGRRPPTGPFAAARGAARGCRCSAALRSPPLCSPGNPAHDPPSMLAPGDRRLLLLLFFYFLRVDRVPQVEATETNYRLPSSPRIDPPRDTLPRAQEGGTFNSPSKPSVGSDVERWGFPEAPDGGAKRRELSTVGSV